MSTLKDQRLTMLRGLDAAKTNAERNKLGQFATPPRVADEMVRYGLNLLSQSDIRYLEPGFGTGTFYNHLLEQTGECTITRAVGYEVDPHYAGPAHELYAHTGLDLRMGDFTEATPEPFDLLLCNPPYVRHHHLTSIKKVALANAILQRYNGVHSSGLTGLYNYFMMLGEAWLSDTGVAAYLVPSEFLDVNYGVAVKSFLLQHVQLIRVHLFESEEVQFDDALVSSAVVWYRKGRPSASSRVELSYGGSLLAPAHSRLITHTALDPTTKWTREIRNGAHATEDVAIPPSEPRPILKDFFDVKRGLATGDNSFFVLTAQRAQEHGLPAEVLTPVIPSPRHLKSDVIHSDVEGYPINVEPLFLLNCRQQPEELALQHPQAWAYLQTGVGTVSKKYLCGNRKLWYMQEAREPAPILCTYMGRGRNDGAPFRFILNESKAVATNSFLMLYPKAFWRDYMRQHPQLLTQVWTTLSAITTKDLVNEGRTYGGGLEKIEPSELGNVPVSQLKQLLERFTLPSRPTSAPISTPVEHN
jgi:hypothetical protein